MSSRWILAAALFAGGPIFVACSSDDDPTPPSEPAVTGVESPSDSAVGSATTEAPFTIDGPAQVDQEQLDGG